MCFLSARCRCFSVILPLCSPAGTDVCVYDYTSKFSSWRRMSSVKDRRDWRWESTFIHTISYKLFKFTRELYLSCYQKNSRLSEYLCCLFFSCLCFHFSWRVKCAETFAQTLRKSFGNNFFRYLFWFSIKTWFSEMFYNVRSRIFTVLTAIFEICICIYCRLVASLVVYFVAYFAT